MIRDFIGRYGATSDILVLSRPAGIPHTFFREVKIEMTNRRDDTPKTEDTGQRTENDNQHFDAPPSSHLPVALPFGATTDAPLEDLPVPGDSHSKHSYYYDDATNYKVFNPDEDED